MRKKKRREHNRESRKKRRAGVAGLSTSGTSTDFTPPKPLKRVCFKRVKEALSLAVDFDEDEVPVAATGWVGKAIDPDGKIYPLEDLLGPKFGMKYIAASS